MLKTKEHPLKGIKFNKCTKRYYCPECYGLLMKVLKSGVRVCRGCGSTWGKGEASAL